MHKVLFILSLLFYGLAAFAQAPGPNVPKKPTATIPAAPKPPKPKPQITKPDIEKPKPQITKPDIAMVSIPSGTFTMGSPISEVNRGDNETQHKVTLSSFKMSKYEITFDHYDAYCEATGAEKPDDEGWGRGNRPVIKVSWVDASEYCEWLSKQAGIDYRLPTEAEWEYASRAGTTTPFNTGKYISTSQANFNTETYGTYPYVSNSDEAVYRQRTLPVGSFLSNAWGIFDMHGNVEEWCSDWYGLYLKDEKIDPKGHTTGHNKVIRGGGWDSGVKDCRSAYREEYNVPGFSGRSLGFRLVSPK